MGEITIFLQIECVGNLIFYLVRMSWNGNQHLYKQSRIWSPALPQNGNFYGQEAFDLSAPLGVNPALNKGEPTHAKPDELQQNKMTTSYIWPLLAVQASETEHCVFQWWSLKCSGLCLTCFLPLSALTGLFRAKLGFWSRLFQTCDEVLQSKGTGSGDLYWCYWQVCPVSPNSGKSEPPFLSINENKL